MSPSRIRYVTACQQLLALGVVLAALAPAAGVMSLDVIREAPGAGRGMSIGTGTALTSALAVAAPAPVSATVPTTVVESTVDEVALTTPQGAPTGDAVVPDAPAGVRERRTTTGPAPVTELVSAPEPVTGYGAVGVTWAPGVELAEDAIAVQVRTRTDGSWSGWSGLAYDDEHGPDPTSDEAATARPGTDEAFVGEVDEVQVKVATSRGPLPADLSLAVVDPGEQTRVARQAPALVGGAPSTGPEASPAGTGVPGAADGLSLRAAGVAQPTIYSRAQWGADERLRGQGAPDYGTVQGGFVHHTVNANDYTAEQVPGILRSIYAYHVRSRGWRDVGYNFLVDRFGRVWEGRYGGIDKAVVGAHTSGMNSQAFALSAIGNFDLVEPSAAMVQAYGTLMAWKLSLSGVSAAATGVRMGSRTFPSSIMGHRDADQTACPGRFLYAQLPTIRSTAASAQGGASFGPPWTGRALSSNLAGSPWPDLVVRRASDGRGVLLTTGGLTRFAAPSTVSRGWRSARRLLLTPDLTGDGRTDLVVVGSSSTPKVRPGTAAGRFGKARKLGRVLAGHDLLTAVGDVNRDGRNDLVGRAADGSLRLFLGKGGRGFTQRAVAGSWKGYRLLVGVGDVTGDGRADLMARDRKGKLSLFKAKGDKGAFAKRRPVAGRWSRYDAIVGGGDYDGDRRPDLVVRRAKTGEVSVLPGRGGVSFAPALGPVAGLKGGDWLSGGPVGAPGVADLVVRSGNKLLRLDNAGTTEVQAPVVTDLDLTGASLVLNAGDFDRDGQGDVIVRDAAGALLLRPGNGAGSFGAGIVIGIGFAGVDGLAAVADGTGDGLPDLVGTPAGGAPTLWPGSGRAALQAARGGASYAVAPAGTDLGRYDWVVPISDGNGDGTPDLLVRRAGTGLVYLLTGSPAALGAPRFVTAGAEVYDLAG